MITLEDRWLLVLDDVQAQIEEGRKKGVGAHETVTAETLTDTIMRHCTGVCDGYCTTDECCDFRRLEVLVYRSLEQAGVKIDLS